MAFITDACKRADIDAPLLPHGKIFQNVILKISSPASNIS